MPDSELSQSYPAGEEVISVKTETVYKCPAGGCDYTSECSSCAKAHCYDPFWFGEGA